MSRNSDPPPPRRYAEGSYGIVEPSLNRETGGWEAAKRLKSNVLAGALAEMAIKRFEREYEVLHQLDHPHIVKALRYEQGSLGPVMYMEWLDGRPLLEIKKPISTVRAVRILYQLADALSAMSHVGYVHRDLKPDNVMHSWSCGWDHVRIIDLGSAHDLFNDTIGHGIVSSWAHMAPELWELNGKRREPGDIDERVDIYALGLIGYTLLTGEDLIVGRHGDSSGTSWREAHLAPQRRRLSHILGSGRIPPDLDALLHSMVSVDRRDRPHLPEEICTRLADTGLIARDVKARQARKPIGELLERAELCLEERDQAIERADKARAALEADLREAGRELDTQADVHQQELSRAHQVALTLTAESNTAKEYAAQQRKRADSLDASLKDTQLRLRACQETLHLLQSEVADRNREIEQYITRLKVLEGRPIEGGLLVNSGRRPPDPNATDPLGSAGLTAVEGATESSPRSDAIDGMESPGREVAGPLASPIREAALQATEPSDTEGHGVLEGGPPIEAEGRDDEPGERGATGSSGSEGGTATHDDNATVETSSDEIPMTYVAVGALIFLSLLACVWLWLRG